MKLYREEISSLATLQAQSKGMIFTTYLCTLQVITDVVPINPQAHESEYQEDMINIYSQLAKACSGEPLSWENLNLSNSLIDFIVIAMSLHHFHIHINIYTQTQTFYKHDTLP